jgi:hypothetical protein
MIEVRGREVRTTDVDPSIKGGKINFQIGD